MPEPTWRIGKSIEDFCRPCKSIRAHTVTLLDANRRPQRVICDTCGSQHQYRGIDATDATEEKRSSAMPAMPPMPEDPHEEQAPGELERLLRRILREETGWTPTAMAEKWRGGDVVLRPGKAGLQEKTFPIDVLFRKIVAVRNKLRVLEQQVNASELPEDAKIRLQGYVTGCYGALTSFNVLFAKDEDRFRGTGGSD